MTKFFIIWTLTLSASAFALQASTVFFEFLPGQGIYRVRSIYTIPELKEKREVRAEFRSKKEAEQFYWNLVKGGDFKLGDPKSVEFVNPPLKADPW